MKPQLILLVFSLVCFVLGAWGGPVTPHWNRLVAAGLAFLAASMVPW
jgi:hypothetical protein